MKKNQSYSTINGLAHNNHVLVKALRNKMYYDFELIYASHFASDAGWTCVRCSHIDMPTWLGYTTKEALKTIALLKITDPVLHHHLCFNEKEHTEIGESGLHVKTEQFYINYGVDNAIKYYTIVKEDLRKRFDTHLDECSQFSDCINIINKLLKLKSIK